MTVATTAPHPLVTTHPATHPTGWVTPTQGAPVLELIRDLLLRIPSDATAATALRDGLECVVPIGNRKRIHITLKEVRLYKPALPELQVVPEGTVQRMLTLSVLARRGEEYRHPDVAHLTDREIDAGPTSVVVHPSFRGQRVLARVLGVRARLRAESEGV